MAGGGRRCESWAGSFAREPHSAETGADARGGPTALSAASWRQGTDSARRTATTRPARTGSRLPLSLFRYDGPIRVVAAAARASAGHTARGWFAGGEK